MNLSKARTEKHEGCSDQQCRQQRTKGKIQGCRCGSVSTSKIHSSSKRAYEIQKSLGAGSASSLTSAATTRRWQETERSVDTSNGFMFETRHDRRGRDCQTGPGLRATGTGSRVLSWSRHYARLCWRLPILNRLFSHPAGTHPPCRCWTTPTIEFVNGGRLQTYSTL